MPLCGIVEHANHPSETSLHSVTLAAAVCKGDGQVTISDRHEEPAHPLSKQRAQQKQGEANEAQQRDKSYKREQTTPNKGFLQ